MRKVFYSIFFSVLAAVAHAESSEWSVTLVQGSKQFKIPGEFRIKKAPFKFVFTGPPKFGFGVVASVDCNYMKTLTTEEDISQVIRPTNLAAEGLVPENIFLVVNGVGALKVGNNTAHVWAEDTESDQHSFQKIRWVSKRTMEATREIREVVQYNNHIDSSTIQISQYATAEVCVLITGLPPVGKMLHESPKFVRLHFE